MKILARKPKVARKVALIDALRERPEPVNLCAGQNRVGTSKQN